MSCTGEEVGRLVLIVGDTVAKSFNGAEVGDSVKRGSFTDPVVGDGVVGTVDAGGILTESMVGDGVVMGVREGSTGIVATPGVGVLIPQMLFASVIISVQMVAP